MPLFKNINYGRLIYEALRNYFAVNAFGDLTIMYKFCAACLFVLQARFNAYDINRRIAEIVANCKWQIGQLTNVLNFLYDPTLKRIFISQATILTVSAVEFEYAAILQAQEFEVAAMVQMREFGDRSGGTSVTINVPIGTDIPAITATIEQIKISGIDYTINEF